MAVLAKRPAGRRDKAREARPASIPPAGREAGGRWLWLVPLAVFLAVFWVHVRSDVRISGDSLWSIHTSLSLVRERNLDLDEYADILDIEGFAYTHEAGGRHYTDFPIGVSLFAVPFVYVVDRMAYFLLNFDFREHISHTIPTNLESVVASFSTALTAVFVYLSARRWTGSVRVALVLAAVCAYGTSAWSSASRGLGQHGPSMLMLSIAVYVLVVARERPWVAQFAALPLAFGYIIRPTNSLPILLLTAYVAVRHLRWLVPFACWGLLVAAPFVLYSLSIYGVPLPKYYVPSRLGGSPTLIEALAGNLVSPARGLLVWSPVFLLAFGSATYRAVRGRLTLLEGCLAATVVLHWVSVSSFPHWWGGWSIGPRLFSDMVPFLSLLLAPAVAACFAGRGWPRAVLVAALIVTAAVSVDINRRAATIHAVYDWNGDPVDVDTAPGRLWDWSDLPFLRYREPNPATSAGR